VTMPLYNTSGVIGFRASEILQQTYRQYGTWDWLNIDINKITPTSFTLITSFYHPLAILFMLAILTQYVLLDTFCKYVLLICLQFDSFSFCTNC
jgi:hypothetical protein